MTPNVIEILLVEDNPNDVKLTLHALKKHNIANKLKIVRDGVEALEYLFQEGAYAGVATCPKPRVILLDLKLPRLDGLEVLRRIRSDRRTKSLPVVMLTSSRQDQDITESYGLGVNSYIVKPVDFDQFSEAVRQLGLYWVLLNEPDSTSEPSPGDTDRR